MRALRPLMVLALGAALAVPAHTRAWESECRPGDGASYTGGRATGFDASICAGFDASHPFCAPGTDFARGAQIGEHGHIANEALNVAGLSGYAGATFDLSYWGTTATVSAGDPARPSATVPSIAPARVGAMSHRVTRPVTMAGFAQLADGSHSVSDYLFGNEHCVVSGLPRRDAVGNRACHTFGIHMGLVNSTHFLPQAREVYRRYHRTAADLMMRCADLATRLGTSAHPWVIAHRTEITRSCEREAMAVETFASHFLADAWSSGHMWERWGAPDGPADELGRLDLATVAIVSGFIHGFRSVIREHSVPFSEHDRLCMPGPGGDDDADAVRWRQPAQMAAEGGGDLYLLACNAYERDARHAVASGMGHQRQLNRMRACIAHGMGEIYDLGPHTLGPRAGNERVVDSGVNAAEGDECWTARVTNHSLRMGLSGTFDLADPSFVTFLAIEKGVSETGAASAITDAQLDQRGDRMRIEVARIGARIAMRDSETDHLTATDMATLGESMLQSLMGIGRNSTYASEIAELGYLDAHDVTSWHDLAGTAPCTVDADCAQGELCDPTAGPGVTRACVRQEVAFLREFRSGEIARACSDETAADLDAARALCRTVGGEACDACTEVLLPHLRNGCDEQSWLSVDGTTHPEYASVCDELRRVGAITVTPVGVYDRYHVGDVTDAERAARGLCVTPPPPPPTTPPTWDPPGTATPPVSTLVDTIGSYFENHAWCGPVTDYVTWHQHHEPYAGPPHTHTFLFETAVLLDLPMSVPFDHFVFERLASCAPGAAVASAGVPVDSSGDGTPDALQIDWTPPIAGEDICLRLRDTMDLDVTGWRLRILP